MGTLENKMAASNALVMRRSSTVLPSLGSKKRKRNIPRSNKTQRNVDAVQKEFEEIKRSTVARLEALLRDTGGLIINGEETDVNENDARQIAQLGIQVESALFDVAHWR